MTSEEYLTNLRQRLARYFDFKDDASCGDIPFSLLAELHSADEGYFIVPSLKIYSVKHNEFIYALSFKDGVDVSLAQRAIDYIKEEMRSMKPDREHMSSIFVLLCLCEGDISDAVKKDLLATKFHKDYAFSLKGWSDLAVVLVDLPNGVTDCNKAGRKVEQYFKV